MPFVKLDCGILNSTLWFERECREVFLTALLMAEPFETRKAMPQIAVDSLENTGWSVPPGWYGFVPAAGIGIVHRARVAEDVGLQALARLGEPEKSSRSPEFDGRRLVRVDGGYIVLNYMKYRERDYTSAERSRRYRERKAGQQKAPSRRSVSTSHRDITQAEAEAEAEVKKTSERGATKTDEIETLPMRAGRLREELYPAWYAKHRNGARLRLVANSLEFQDAMSLVATWDDERLEKLAAIVLTTDDDWIARTDRGFKIFAMKASWADDRLREWEAKRRPT